MTEYIIILGCSDETILKTRCDSAAIFFKTMTLKNRAIQQHFHESEHYSPDYLIICSGGGKGEISEASRMKQYLLSEHSISMDSILTEDLSQNTVENIINCRNILIASKLIGDITFEMCLKNIIICTSTSHMNRAFVIAQTIFSNDRINSIKTLDTNEIVDELTKNRELILLDKYISKFTHENSKLCALPETPGKAKVTFFRHSTSTFNEYGDKSRDCPITENAKLEASVKITGTFDIVICSILLRARQTLEYSSLIYKKSIFTPLCREVLSGNPINLLVNEENHVETETEIQQRIQSFNLMLKTLACDYKNIAVISHCMFLNRITNRTKFKNSASVYRYIDV